MTTIRIRSALALAAVALLGVACKPVVPPPPATQTLTVVVAAGLGDTGPGGQEYTAGEGAVRGAGLDCHTPVPSWVSEPTVECVTEVPTGTTVALRAAPDTNTDAFTWGGACAGSGDCVVKMDGPRRVTASFTPIMLWLSAGCVSYADLPWPCGTTTVTTSTGAVFGPYEFGEFAFGYSGVYHAVRVVPGTTVTVTVTLDPADEIVWGSDNCPDAVGGNTCTLTVDSIQYITVAGRRLP